MTESSKQNVGKPPSAGKNRQRWSKPVLSRYGKVKDLTASGTQGMMEMGIELQPFKKS
jgi:hypothetical protein